MKKRSLIAVFCAVIGLSLLVAAGTASNVNAGDDFSDVTDPSMEIYGYNVSYADSVYLIYAVRSEGFDTQKHPVRLLVWTGLPEGGEYVYGTETYSTETVGQSKIGGYTCDLFYSRGIAAKEMTVDFYVCAYVSLNGTEY